MTEYSPSRRRLIRLGGIVAAGVVFAPHVLTRAVRAEENKGVLGEIRKAVGAGEPEVPPPEDLMREHGVLDRVLLVYEEAIRRLNGRQDLDPSLISDSASIVRDFIHDYHEKSEETYVFPRFRKANQLVPLIDTLVTQHDAGRKVTDRILASAPRAGSDDAARQQAVQSMQAFLTMYRPHAAREDTDVFPKLRKLVSSNEFDSMAEAFEQEERRKFGDDGFTKMVDRVAGLEKRAGIADLSRVTPG